MIVSGLFKQYKKSDSPIPSSLLQVINSLFQQLGTSRANTICQRLVNRIVTTCMQVYYNLCVCSCVELTLNIGQMVNCNENDPQVLQFDSLKCTLISAVKLS